MVRPQEWVGRTWLEAAILWYRRRVSGRGPLRSVVCSFGESESCSAYGLRVVQQRATSLPSALAMIFGRIRRCRNSSVYRDRVALLWGADYDDLARVDDVAREAFEQPKTRVALLRAAIAVARYRGHNAFGRLCSQLRTAVTGLRSPHARLPLRDGSRLSQRLRARWQRSLRAAAALLVVCLFLPRLVELAAAFAVLAFVVGTTRRWIVEERRYDQQRRLAHFDLA